METETYALSAVLPSPNAPKGKVQFLGTKQDLKATQVNQDRQATLNKLLQIRQQAFEIRDQLMSSDIEVVKVAEKDLERLLGQFYDDNRDTLAPQQYETAKNDFGYFLALIEMAIGYYSVDREDLRTHALH